MKTHFDKTKLGDVVNVISKTYQFKDSESVIFINTGDILEGKFLHSKRSNPSSLPGQAKKSIQKGDILFSEIRPANKRYALVDFDADDYVVSTKLMVLRPKDNIDPQYLYIWLTMPSTLQNFQMIAESRSGTFPQITFDAIRNEEIPYPPLSSQHRIASILSSFDNKIELLRKENNTLEDIAQSIFKEWFVKYNFPNKDGKPYRDNNGKMIDSELGLIPDGWRVEKLGEFCELKSGYAFKGNDFTDKSHTKVIKIKDLKGNGEIDLTNLSSVNDDSIQQNNIVKKFLLSSGDILIAMSGNTTGKIGRMNKARENVYLNQRVGKLFFKSMDYYSYVYNFLTVNNYEEKILSMGYGSAQPNINPSQINDIAITVPPIALVTNYSNIALLLMDKCTHNSDSLRILESEKNFLLNKLLR